MKPVIEHLLFSELPKISRGRGIVNHLIASKKNIYVEEHDKQ